MATEKGVWDLQDVRDKQLAGEWTYEAGGALWVWGANTRGMFGLNQSQASFPSASSPTQVGADSTWGGSDYDNKIYVASAYNSFFALKKQ